MTSFYAFTSVFEWTGENATYDRFRVDGDKNMRLPAFAFTIVFVWTGPNDSVTTQITAAKQTKLVIHSSKKKE